MQRRILMILENNPFPADVRVRHEAQALVSTGYQVSVIAPRGPGQALRESVSGVQVYRVPMVSIFQGKLAYLWEYSSFIVLAFVWSLAVAVTRGFDAVHLHNPPDVLFVIGLFYKLMGKKLVFDHHDPSPEVYTVLFGRRPRWVYNALLWAERATCRSADHIIANNESHCRIEMERSKVDRDKVSIVRNGPKLGALSPVRALPPRDETNTVCYLGVVGPQDGVEILLRSVHHIVRTRCRDVRCTIIGDGDALKSCKGLAQTLGIADHVEFAGWVPDQKAVADLLGRATVCVDPAPLNELTKHQTMIKIMEYMAMARPVVAFDLPETRYSAREAALYARPNDVEDLAGKIVQLLDDANLRDKLGRFGRERVESALSWDYSEEALLRAYQRVLAA